MPRDLDLVLTGSVLHPYFPDKAEMMRQMLAAEGFEPYFLSGFLFYYVYYPVLARSKISVALTRHLGAIPSRGYEALAMGTVLMAPQESCMRLFADIEDELHKTMLILGRLRKCRLEILAIVVIAYHQRRRHRQGHNQPFEALIRRQLAFMRQVADKQA